MDRGSEDYRKYCEIGDEEAFVRLIVAYRDGLIYFLNRIVRDLNRAQELAEDTFVRIGIRRPMNRGGASFKSTLLLLFPLLPILVLLLSFGAARWLTAEMMLD